MSSFKEIVTKAVIGKAKKSSTNTFELTSEEKPNTVLGCWVINHSFTGKKGNDEKVLVNGSYDVNVWYSYDADKKTAVTTKNFEYNDSMQIPLKDNAKLTNTNEIIVRCLKQPTVSNVRIENEKIILEIEKEMGVEVVGDTKVKIAALEDEDDYVELYDDVTLEDEIDKIDEEYLNEK